VTINTRIGAAAGGLAGFTFGGSVVAGLIADAALGAATNVANGAATAGEDGRSYSASDAAIDAATGAAFGIVGFGATKGASAAAKAMTQKAARLAEQARVAKVWKAANEKPYTGNPDEIACSNPGQAANGVADTTARLQSHVGQAVADYDSGGISMSSRQARAVGRNPNLEPTYRGQVIDSAVKNATRNDSDLSHLWVSRTGEFGPDFHDIGTNTWWDVTTPGQWSKHVDSYIYPFGAGIGLFTR
jgi:hypothetical protein